jgi:hypothetical protein
MIGDMAGMSAPFTDGVAARADNPTVAAEISIKDLAMNTRHFFTVGTSLGLDLTTPFAMAADNA